MSGFFSFKDDPKQVNKRIESAVHNAIKYGGGPFVIDYRNLPSKTAGIACTVAGSIGSELNCLENLEGSYGEAFIQIDPAIEGLDPFKPKHLSYMVMEGFLNERKHINLNSLYFNLVLSLNKMPTESTISFKAKTNDGKLIDLGDQSWMKLSVYPRDKNIKPKSIDVPTYIPSPITPSDFVLAFSFIYPQLEDALYRLWFYSSGGLVDIDGLD